MTAMTDDRRIRLVGHGSCAEGPLLLLLLLLPFYGHGADGAWWRFRK